MKKSHLFLGLALIFSFFSMTVFADEAQAADMYRLYNKNSGEHFYTADSNEKNHLVKVGWRYEGIGWTAPASGNAVYRLYNKNAGDHHYTLNTNEKNHLVKVGWRYEGIGWYSDTKKSVPLYRAYNPNARAGSHNYTVNYNEQKNLLRAGWRNEGIAWYGIKKGAATVAPKHVDVNITGVGGDEQNNPGSYRLLYSNKAFDQASLSGNAIIEFSADVALTGKTNDYETQFVIAGNGKGSGQIGIGLHYQAGSDANFAQGRINATNINFPAGAQTKGQQYYSVNTKVPRITNGQSVHLQVKYFASGYMQTLVNNNLVGQYKTKLVPGGDAYILHDNTNATVKIRHLKVLKNGVDVTKQGKPSFGNTNFDFSNGVISGAY